jgi:extracellular factor (EF) 3-hydroxypalmitic acid methyl ester biosynthesis protein
MKVQERYFEPSIQTSMMEKIHPLLAKITSSSEKELVENFWRKATRYFGVIYGLEAALEQGEIDEEHASDILIKETDTILPEGKKLEDAIQNNDHMRMIKKVFRECVIPLGIKSKIVKHAFTKPSGYAGDYGLIEIIYNQKTLSNKIGYCIDRRFQMDDYARAVRSRKNKMKDILADFIRKAPGKSVEILNVACGSCREIKEMFDENTFDGSKRISFTLMDQDRDALEFSLNALKNSPTNVEYHTQCNSVYDYIKNPDTHRGQLFGKDLIYTIGLADYIPDSALKSLIVFMYSLLKPGGSLIIAHKDSKNFSPLAADWWCDWTFHLRNEPETINLVKTSGIMDFDISVKRENETNIIFFMTIEKKQ